MGKDKEWRTIDKFLRENFWKDFSAKLDKRTTEKQYHKLFQFEIGVQERRLNQYREQLRPDLYTEDYMAVNEQKDLVEKLKLLYEQFKNENVVNIEPIKLNYGDKNGKVIELIHSKLFPNFIKCSLNELQLHFIEQENYSPIQWYRSETSIVDMFKNRLALLNDDWTNVITFHFFNKKGQKFKRKQIISVGSDRINSEYRDSQTIREVEDTIANL